MIHSLSGGRIENYDTLIYAFVEMIEGSDCGQKRWYISPFPKIKAGDLVLAPCGVRGEVRKGKVLKAVAVTKQTAPYPVNRTREIERILR